MFKNSSLRDRRYSHAMQRAYERYGMELDEDSLDLLACKVKSGDSILVKEYNADRSSHLVDHQGVTFLTVYSREADQVLTFLWDKKLETPELKKKRAASRYARVGWRKKFGKTSFITLDFSPSGEIKKVFDFLRKYLK